MFIVVIFHLFYVLVVELNVKVIPVKYGRELTHYKLESNNYIYPLQTWSLKTK